MYVSIEKNLYFCFLLFATMSSVAMEPQPEEEIAAVVTILIESINIQPCYQSLSVRRNYMVPRLKDPNEDLSEDSNEDSKTWWRNLLRTSYHGSILNYSHSSKMKKPQNGKVE